MSGVSFGDCMTDEIFVHQQNEKDKEIKFSKDKEIDLSKEKEIELLKKQLKLMAEKNVHLETSLDEEKVKNHDLQQEIDHVNATSTAKLKVVEDSLYDKTNEVEFLKKEASTTSSKLKSLEDSLSRKTNEVDHMNKQMDIQAKDHQACKKELIATKNQLFYKHLALDGVIKSNIKLQEQLATAVNIASDKQIVKQNSSSQTSVSGVDEVSKSNSRLQKQSTDLACVDKQNMKKTARDTVVSLQTHDTSVFTVKDAGCEKSNDAGPLTTSTGQTKGPNNKKQNKHRRRNKKRFE